VDTCGRVGGHCQARVDARPWSIRLAPVADELLSSYLVRSAHAHGMHPMRFASLHFPGAQIWNRDIDVCAHAPLLGAIAMASNLSVDLVSSMTLGRLIPNKTGKDEAHPCHSSWLTSLGMHGRFRSGTGLRYCPLCLQANDAFLRMWRLTFAFACPIHHRMLEDQCAKCGGTVVPHRSRLRSFVCHQCGMELHGSSMQALDAIVDEALRVQDRFLGFCARGHLQISGGPVPSLDFFVGLQILLKVLREKMHSHPTEFKPSCHMIGQGQEGPRLSATITQLCLLTRLLEIFDGWPDKFLHAGRVLMMSQAAFARYGIAPTWLEDGIKQLPTTLRPHHVYTGATLLRRVRAVEVAGGPNCRERRACELFNAARDWS
jgi:hypothetical protein